MQRQVVLGLEGFSSTIELHPHATLTTHRTPAPQRGRNAENHWWRGKDSNLRRQCRQIYSLIPLTAREPLQREAQDYSLQDFGCQTLFAAARDTGRQGPPLAVHSATFLSLPHPILAPVEPERRRN